MELTSLDLHYLAIELRKLVGAKVEKIVQSDVNKKDLLFTLYLRDWPKLYLRILLPGLICLHDEKPASYPKVPPGFAMFLRKYLQGARVTDVRQRGFDRILEIDLEKGVKCTLLLELLPPGNMIVLIDDKIKGLLENQNFKDRTLRGGIAYEAPPATTHPQNLSDEKLISKITTSDKNSIVTILAIDLSLGGVYAEEACARAGIDKQRNDLSREEIVKVADAVRKLFSEEIFPCSDEHRAYPFTMQSRSAKPTEGLFLTALGAFVPEPVVVKVKDDNQMERMVTAQEKSIKKLEQQHHENARIAEVIYEQYALMQEIIAAAREAREKKENVESALKKFPQVKNFIPKTGEIEIEL